MKSIRRMIAAGALALVLVSTAHGTTAFADPTPAPKHKTQQNDTSRSGTGDARIMAPDGNFYAFEHLDLSGRWCSWTGNDQDWRFNTRCPWFSDIASSVWNNSYTSYWDDVMVCTDIDYGFPCVEIKHSEVVKNLHAFGWGDRISSHYWR